jgi:hypothetical protein
MNRPNPLNPEIQSVLEAHGLDWNTFMAMDPRAYEQQLARHSPSQLDAFYSVRFAPGLSQDQHPASLPCRRREENKTKSMISRSFYKSPTPQKQTKQKTMTTKSNNIKHLLKSA